MELRGFGKNKKRTWYVQRPFARNDYLVLGLGVLLLVLSLVITFWTATGFTTRLYKSARLLKAKTCRAKRSAHKEASLCLLR